MYLGPAGIPHHFKISSGQHISVGHIIIAMSMTTTTVGNDGGGYEDFVVIDESRWALG